MNLDITNVHIRSLPSYECSSFSFVDEKTKKKMGPRREFCYAKILRFFRCPSELERLMGSGGLLGSGVPLGLGVPPWLPSPQGGGGFGFSCES